MIALDAGNVCQNLYLTCEAIGAGTCAIAAYDQNLSEGLLGVDGDDEFTVYVASVGKVRNLSEIFKLFAQSQMIRHVTTHHYPKVRTMVSYLNMAEFVDDNIVKAGWWCFDQVEIEGNTFGFVGITTPTCFHGADGDGWQWNPFCLHQAMAFD